jgi:hypothetical protein
MLRTVLSARDIGIKRGVVVIRMVDQVSIWRSRLDKGEYLAKVKSSKTYFGRCDKVKVVNRAMIDL